MIVSLSSIAGAPGVSSLTMLLAAGWPAEYTAPGSTSESLVRMGRVALECDLDGGVYGARYGIGVEPGAATLVSRMRHSPDGTQDVDLFGRSVGDQAWVIPGPESAEAARQLWSGVGVAESVADACVRDDRVWFVDAGRAGSSSLIAPMLSNASLSLLVCRADHESVVQVPPRVNDLRSIGCSVGVVIVGKPPFPNDELSEFFDTSLLWTLPAADDIVALSRSVWSSKKVRRSLTWRAALEISHDVAERVAFRTVRAISGAPTANDSDNRAGEEAVDGG